MKVNCGVVRLIRKFSGVSNKTGKPFTILTVADTVTFENLDVFPESSVNVNDLVEGQNYNMQLDFHGRSHSVALTPVKG